MGLGCEEQVNLRLRGKESRLSLVEVELTKIRTLID